MSARAREDAERRVPSGRLLEGADVSTERWTLTRDPWPRSWRRPRTVAGTRWSSRRRG
jgi:hypothetical protein